MQICVFTRRHFACRYYAKGDESFLFWEFGLLYGKFSYEDGILYDTYLPENCFPDCDEETYYEQLDELLSTNSQTKIIGEV